MVRHRAAFAENADSTGLRRRRRGAEGRARGVGAEAAAAAAARAKPPQIIEAARRRGDIPQR